MLPNPFPILKILPVLLLAGMASAEVIFDWKPDSAHMKQQSLTALTGPAGTLSGAPAFDTEGLLEFRDKQHVEFPETAATKVPAGAFSVEATVRIDQPEKWGSIIAHSQDNGSYERGWILGYNGDRFSFRLSTGGALTGATASSPFSPGQWAHVVGIFDGESVKLYIDGTLAASSAVTGKVVRPDIPTPFVLGAYKDKDEFFPMQGRVRQVRIHDTALAPAEIAKLGPQGFPFTVRPAVRFLGPDSAEVLWESSEPGRGTVTFGTSMKLGFTAESDSEGTRHRVVLGDLERGTVYHYRIAARTADGMRSGKIHTFDTTLNELPPDLSDVIPPSADPAVRDHAAAAVTGAGFPRGFCLVLGLTDGELLRELARVSGLTIIGVDSDAARISSLRRALHADGLYGPRITITAVADLAKLPFSSCLANLVVSEHALAGGKLRTPKKEIIRILRPDGCAVLAGPDGFTHRRTELDHTGDWSHQYADPANTAASGDALGAANGTSDFSLQWIGRPGADFGIDRNPRMPAPLAVSGRLFHQGMNRMVALDSFNGQVLWSVEAPDLRRVNIPHDCGNWCAHDDTLYVAVRDRAWAIDAATGARTGTFKLTTQQRGSHDWGFIACTDDLLFGSSVPFGAQYKNFWGGAMWFDKAGDINTTALVCSDNVFAYDRESADGRWAYGRGLIINSTITIAGNRMWFIESHPPEGSRKVSGRVAGNDLWKRARVVCLATATGKVVWERPLEEPAALSLNRGFIQVAYGSHTSEGFMLVLSEGHTDTTGDKPTIVGNYSYRLFADADGARRWKQTTAWRTNNHGSHMSHPVVLPDRVYVEPTGVTLADGKVLDHTFGPREGCSTVVAGRDTLFFRGINRCVTQWSLDSRTPTKWSRLRPSCWLNMIPAQGMMLIPEGGGGCSCGGWMETSLGFLPNSLLTRP
jgi:outer membrane protein assembly factor BamB